MIYDYHIKYYDLKDFLGFNLLKYIKKGTWK